MANPVQETPILPGTPVGKTTIPDMEVDLTQSPSPTGDWLEENQKLVIGIVGALVAIAAGIFLYRTFVVAPAQAAATENMWHAQRQFEQDSFDLALYNPAPGYLGFEDIAKEYGNTEAGNLANYYAGISFLQLGQYEAAISALNDYDEEGDLLPVTKAGALGDAHAQLGDLAKAKGYYEEAVDEADDNSLLAPYYLKKLALLNEREGNTAAANGLYVRIRDEFPEATEATDVEKYILRTQS